MALSLLKLRPAALHAVLEAEQRHVRQEPRFAVVSARLQLHTTSVYIVLLIAEFTLLGAVLRLAINIVNYTASTMAARFWISWNWFLEFYPP
jgi:hypothetical protein